MAIDITQERMLSLTAAAKQIPGNPSICTIWRWTTRGIKGRLLETVTVGGRRFTSAEAIGRFVTHGVFPAAAPPITTRAQEKRQRQVERELEAAGL